LLDITVWIEKLQKFKISDYYSELRVYITAYSGGLEQAIQNTQHHKMPKAFEAYNDKNYNDIMSRVGGTGLLPADNGRGE
jgi:hypothetical protein